MAASLVGRIVQGWRRTAEILGNIPVAGIRRTDPVTVKLNYCRTAFNTSTNLFVAFIVDPDLDGGGIVVRTQSTKLDGRCLESNGRKVFLAHVHEATITFMATRQKA